MMKLTLIALILFFNFIQADHIMESQSSQNACFAHTDCPENAYCNYQTSPYSCKASACIHDGDCHNSTCVNGACLVPGLNDDDYNSNNTNGPCRSNFDCKKGFRCNFYDWVCQAQPVSCSSDGDCGQGFYCDFFSNWTCQTLPGKACFNDGDCTKPEYCYRRAHARWGICEVRCASHNDCGLNKYCYFDPFFYRCLSNPCNHDGDCLGNSTCQYYLCS